MILSMPKKEMRLLSPLRTCIQNLGHMELVNGDDVLVKQHPCGTFHGTIIPGGLESEYAKYLNIPA